MPGISFVYERDGDLNEKEPKILKSLASLLHYQNYEQKILLKEKDTFLAVTRHGKYPVTTTESNELFICIEGTIYGKQRAAIDNELKNLSEKIFSIDGNYEEDVLRWLFDTDGDFIVFMLHKPSREACIMNNAMARLPLYYFSSGHTLIVSREPRFIADLRGEVRFDRDAISQYLLFGYVPGNKTIFQNIYQLEPASIIKAGGSDAIRIENIHRHNFEWAPAGGKSIKEYRDTLIELLEVACRNRYDTLDKNIMTLSGGMDSRMVASCLAAMGLVFESITFRDTYYISQREVEIAGQVAEALGSDWKSFRVGLARGKDVLKLLKIQSGLNFLGMSFTMPFFRMIEKSCGDRITLFTGEGGDKVLRDIRPVGRIKNIDALTEYVLTHNQLMDLDTVSALTGQAASEIEESLKHHLESYDEQNMKAKYVHFIVYERCLKWLFYGEDRNRFIFWPVAPFYAIDFWSEAMSCPFAFKNRYRLFREMLLRISPEAARIDNYAWNLPITSKKMRLYFSAREMYLQLPSPVRRFVRAHHGTRGALTGYPMESDLVKCFLEQLETCSAISEYLSIDAIRRNLSSLDKMGFDHLFTLTSTIEDFTCAESTIEKYRENELI
jgi:asparagine synthase (glutamine-hydrolysing)